LRINQVQPRIFGQFGIYADHAGLRPRFQRKRSIRKKPKCPNKIN